MKTTFTKQEILQGKGCYSTQQASDWFDNLSMGQNALTIAEILNSKINIKDKRWFVYNSCDLILEEKKELSLLLAWAVLPIFELKYPNDNRVKACLEGIEKFNKGEITRDELLILRRAAYDAAADADAAYAAAYAYAAAKDLAYTQKLNSILLTFMK